MVLNLGEEGMLSLSACQSALFQLVFISKCCIFGYPGTTWGDQFLFGSFSLVSIEK